MTSVTPEEAKALRDGAMSVHVEGHDGEMVSAVIWPTELTSGRVSGMVEWHGTNLLSSLAGGEGKESPWGQRLLLLWAGVGPENVAAVPVLGAKKWRLAQLAMPDIEASPTDSVKVSISKQDWTATMTRTRDLKRITTQQIPMDLQKLDVGSIMADMTSRLLMHRPWLS